MLAEGLGLSGIVSILFTGIVSVFFYLLLVQISLDYDEAVMNPSLGHETLYILKFVRQFSTICVCIFPSDIIIGRNICVREYLFVQSSFALSPSLCEYQVPELHYWKQIHIHGIRYCHGATQLVSHWIHLFLNCILLGQTNILKNGFCNISLEVIFVYFLTCSNFWPSYSLELQGMLDLVSSSKLKYLVCLIDTKGALMLPISTVFSEKLS